MVSHAIPPHPPVIIYDCTSNSWIWKERLLKMNSNHRCTVVFKFFWRGTFGCEKMWAISYLCVSLHLWISFLKSFKGVHEILLPLSPPRVHLCKTFTIRKNFHDVKMCFLFFILFKRFYLLFCRGMLLNPHLFTPIHTRPLWTSLFWLVSRNHEKLKESLLNS